MSDPTRRLSTVIFDLGAVVLQWAPHLPYEQVLPADEVPGFMARIDFWNWNRAHDAGQLFEVGERDLIEKFPDSAVAVRAYREHFPHALTGMVEGTGAVIAELQQAGVRLLALTNWSAETFPHARQRFGLLERFDDIVVSGTELLAKPDPELFRLVCRRHQLDPTSCVFVDDSPANVAAAAALGITAVQFSDATRLRAELVDLGLLRERELVTEPLFHLTERDVWLSALTAGEFPWSSRDLSYEQQGYVHCSFRHQVEDVLARVYADVAPEALVVLELDPTELEVPVIVEDLDAGAGYPHLYGPLPLARVSRVHDLPEWLFGWRSTG
jgi:2-haloacid dehalogenase